MQKQSQTQKIDFDKLKSKEVMKKLNIKNHRKSYGLEFIDIKREIQEELRTLDEKFKVQKLLQQLPDQPPNEATLEDELSNIIQSRS